MFQESAIESRPLACKNKRSNNKESLYWSNGKQCSVYRSNTVLALYRIQGNVHQRKENHPPHS